MLNYFNLKVSILIVLGFDNNLSYQCIKSCVQQKHKNIEILLYNNTGKTLNKKLTNFISRNKKKIKFFKDVKKNEVFRVRNFLLKKATGDYISILDSDDKFFKNHIIEALSKIIKYNVHFYYSGYQNRKKNLTIKRIPPKKLTEFDLLTFCPIGHSTVVFKRGYIKKYKSFKFRHDLATWSNLIKKKNVYANNKLTVQRNIHKQNFSKNKFKILIYYFLVLHKSYNKKFITILFYILILIFRHVYFKLK